MDEDKDNLPSYPRMNRRLKKKKEELLSAIIEGYLKDKFELEIYPNEISIKEKANPHSIEIFFSFAEDDVNTNSSEFPED